MAGVANRDVEVVGRWALALPCAVGDPDALAGRTGHGVGTYGTVVITVQDADTRTGAPRLEVIPINAGLAIGTAATAAHTGAVTGQTRGR